MIKKIFPLLIGLFLSCKTEKQPELTTTDITKVLDHMSDIMIHDVTNPPLAARFFSYSCLAGYEVVAENNSRLPKMKGILNEYPSPSKPDSIKNFSTSLASVLAMMETAKKLQPSGTVINKFQSSFIDSCRNVGFEEETIQASLVYAKVVSKEILTYAKKDGYNKISNFVRYTPVDKEGSWYPTPPGFFAPVEPYFNTVRPFTLDSCSQFKPVPPVSFSKEKNSDFYRMMVDNYKTSRTLSSEQQDIAAFWDCNPFALNDGGHMLVGMKKISPGAHWLGITGIACKKKKVAFEKALEIHTVVSIALMDGFICCWDEKYRSNRIRPETAIRKYIDPDYKPLLQTPPFPEYLSGHSTISTASAVILSHYFGDNFGYTDSVEVRFGLPSRDFKSFNEAASEAAISRFYGGIHFRDAIDNGVVQGRKVGQWILGKLNFNRAKGNLVAKNEGHYHPKKAAFNF